MVSLHNVPYSLLLFSVGGMGLEYEGGGLEPTLT